jgi:hypothetical protein
MPKDEDAHTDPEEKQEETQGTKQEGNQSYLKTEVIDTTPNNLGRVKDPNFARYLEEVIESAGDKWNDERKREWEDDRIKDRMEVEITLSVLPGYILSLQNKLNPIPSGENPNHPFHRKADSPSSLNQGISIAVEEEFRKYKNLQGALETARQTGVSIENKTAEQLLEETGFAN